MSIIDKPRNVNQVIVDAVKEIRKNEIAELKELLEIIRTDDEVIRGDLIDIIDMCIETDNVGQSIRDFYESNY